MNANEIEKLAETLAEQIDADTAGRLPSMADTRRNWKEPILQALTTAIESVEKERHDEYKRRLYYQNIVYDCCTRLDVAHGRSVRNGTGILAGTIEEPSNEVRLELEKLKAERDQLQKEADYFNECVKRLKAEKEAVINMSATTIANLHARCAELEKALQKHHDHANESCVVYFEQDGKPIEISTDLAEAYQESGLWEETENALHPQQPNEKD